MPKGAYIPESIKRMVTEIYRNNRRIGPTKAREELLGKMKEDGLDKNFGPNFPGVSSVSKLLTEYRDNDEKRSHESKELDKPWRILDIAKYSIPPEILPTVVEAWGWTLAEQVEPLSIREALWVARLYYIHKERMKGVLPKNRRDAFIYTLICLAKACGLAG